MRLALLLSAVLGCAGTSPRGAPALATATTSSSALDDLLRGDLADDHAFPWSAARRLTWDDFQGTPASGGSEDAMTSYTIYSAWKCRGEAFEFRVIAGFRPRQSWVKARVLNDPAQRGNVLGHEQTHFDLAEVHARAMRRAFADLARPCSKQDGELSALVQRLTDLEKVEQRRYDAETNHGLRASEQAAWSAAVARRLR